MKSTAHRSYSIVNPNSPYSFLEQRLQYANSKLKKPVFFSNNTPQWTKNEFKMMAFGADVLTRYAPSNGMPDLLEAVFSREKFKYNVEIKPTEILITNGALNGISLILRYLYRPRAIALCQAPVLTHIEHILRGCGYEIIYFSINDNVLDSFPQEVKNRIEIIFINIPNNPTGEIGSEEIISKLTHFSNIHGAKIIADLVYDEFVFSPSLFCNPLTIQSCWSNTYVVNSVSKGFGMAGARIGWVISDETNIQLLAGMLENEFIAVSSYGQLQAAHIIDQGNDSLLRQVVSDFDDVSAHLLNTSDLHFTKPDGGTQYFVKLPINDVEGFADFMLIEYEVILTTSSNYKGLSKEQNSCIRIPLGQPKCARNYSINAINKGLRRWKEIEEIKRPHSPSY
jgi:aspartate aminotransferase